jgi:hypothetical protein
MSSLDTLRRDFKVGKPIASFYPITLANGNAVEELTAHCNDCKRVLPDEHFRGAVYSMHEGNTIINNGVGHCQHCLTVFEVSNRIKTDKDSVRLERCINGRWVSTLSKTDNGIFQALRMLINKFFHMNT